MRNNQIIINDDTLRAYRRRNEQGIVDALQLTSDEWAELCDKNVDSNRKQLVKCGFCWVDHGEVQWMQTFTYKGLRIIRHQPGESQDHPYQSVETPRHKAYIHRGYMVTDAEGYNPRKEAWAPDGKTRADLLVEGTVLLSYEHQHSKFKKGYGLAARIERNQTVGRVAMFHTDREEIFKAQKSPMLATNGKLPLEWIEDLNRPLVFTGGLREIIVFTCDTQNGVWCPKGRIVGCGKTHARTELIPGITLDDMLRRAPVGEYRMAFNADVVSGPKSFWTTRESYDRYMSALGGDGKLAPLEGAPADKAKTRNGVRQGHSRAKAEELEAMYAQAVILPNRAVDLSAVAPPLPVRVACRPVLDWRGAIHWGGSLGPCRFCGQQTRLRDDNGEPAHKTCAEEALAS